jgi:hypothetical protein
MRFVPLLKTESDDLLKVSEEENIGVATSQRAGDSWASCM